MTKDNEDSLQLANQIDQFKDKRMNDSAAHLRRLVAENEALRRELESVRIGSQNACDHASYAMAKAESATALVQQMLKALELNCGGNTAGKAKNAITAAREWLEGKA